MTIKTKIFIMLFCLSGLVSTGAFASAHIERDSAAPGNLLGITQCPPVTNLLIETHPGGAAAISWDLVANIPTYSVKVTHSSGYVLLDTLVPAPPVMVHGLKLGERYNVKVCYQCPVTEKTVCSEKEFDYIIIDDYIVMLSNYNCSCGDPVPKSGKCPSSNSYYYTLKQPKIYDLTLQDDSKMTFIVQDGHANPVGSCPSNYTFMGYAQHGPSGDQLPYYAFGNNKIFFHGSDFCIHGAPPVGISYCDIRPRPRSVQPSESPTVAADIYPNPFDQWIAIAIQNSAAKESAFRVELTDATGRLVMVQHFPALTEQVVRLDTESVPSGFYLLRLMGVDGLIAVKQLIKTGQP